MESNDYSIFPEREAVIYAGFWQRFGAAFIDGLILAIPNYLLVWMLNGGAKYGLGNAASLILGWLYFAIQESGAAQATVGKRAVGLKVTDMEGNRLSFMNATGRHFAKFLSILILFIGYLMMIWDEKKQTLHDKIAGTLVVIKQENK